MNLKKELGQHLLNNLSILEKISLMVGDAAVVVEIGPGTGNLTEYLLKNDYIEKLILIEKDPEMVEKIKLRFHDPRIVLLNLDATTINVASFTDQKVTVVGNFPYNVGNAIIINLVEQMCRITKIIAMLQKEVVERFCAKPKTKDYGKLTVLCGAFCNAKRIIDISPNNFTPPPKVMSSILELIPHGNYVSGVVYDNIIKVCNIGFGQRRKKLIPLMRRYFNEQIMSNIALALPNRDIRIEELSIEQIILIAEILSKG